MDYSLFYPILGLVARGRLGTWFISKEYKTQRVIEKYHVPENPRTPTQQANRGLMYDAVYNWKHFDTNTKRYYNQMERPVHMSGYNRYIRMYLNATEPMIIYWDSLKQSASNNVSIPEYIASPYFIPNSKRGAIILNMDGAGAAIASGAQADVRIPFNCVIKNWTLLSDVQADLNVDIWRSDYDTFPPTDSDSITGGHNPYLAYETKRQDLSAIGFYNPIPAGSILRFNIDSAAYATRAHLQIGIEKD